MGGTTEAHPAEEEVKEKEASGVCRVLSCCLLYIAVSACLIHFNKYLMHPERFPFAMALTAGHMLTAFLLCGLLYLLRPSLFPGLARAEGRRLELLRWSAPLGCLFALGLYCSNRAYLYCSVAFLQFMKECNVGLVFAFSCLAGLQQWSRARLLVLGWILLGASLAVVGEVHFVWVGFGLQLLSQLGESGKNVLGEWLMRGYDLKLDPLSFTFLLAPSCLVVLSVGLLFTWQPLTAQRAVEWWHVLLPNAVLAFTLNISVALVIRECSAVAFVLAGLVKDMVIVGACVLFFGEVVLYQQLLGFALCLAGIFCWSYTQHKPHSALARALLVIVGEARKGEQVPILGGKV